VAVAIVGSALMAAAWPSLSHLMAREPNSTAMTQAYMLGLQAAGTLRGSATEHTAARAARPPKIVGVAVASRPGHRKPAVAISSGYQNPLRAVSGLVPERIDEGADFGGTGPVYAIGDAVVTNAGENAGWPGGGWITYRLTDGPEAGLMVYLAEDVTAAVQVGERVNSSTVIANMFNGGDGIETGWAMQSGLSAESELSEAGGIGGGGPFPTRVGVSFDRVLQSLGVPAAPNAAQTAYGVLPAGYPAG
jgi:murein DD-endopeptidase MepM/ murein hydrolase activator NlpD